MDDVAEDLPDGPDRPDGPRTQVIRWECGSPQNAIRL